MTSAIQLIGFCFEGTENAVAGAATGPSMMRWGMLSTEEHSLAQDSGLPEYDDLGDRYFPGLLGEAACDAMQYALASELRPEPYLLLGGDHFVTLPSIRYLVEQRGITPWVVHFDAHLDQRDTYLGGTHTHATVLRRVEEVVGPGRVRSFGIRARAAEEPWDAGRFHPWRVAKPLRTFIEQEAGDAPIYLTFDLDVFDPGLLPAVSNPEPGGIGFAEALDALALLRGRLVAADLVELVPTKQTPSTSAQIAGVVLRELLIALAG